MVVTRELLESLREQVRRIETAGRPDGPAVSLGCSVLDALLPQRGIARGTIHEWLTPRNSSRAPYRGGHGAEVLSLLAAREACRSGGALVVIDSSNCFYPPAAALWGIGLENVIVLRPADRRDVGWAIDQALRCSAVAAVWGCLDWIGERWFRRFQLSAEQSGCLGLFVRPDSAARRATWSESQWLCRGLPRLASFIPSARGASSIPSPSWEGLGRRETDSHTIPMTQNLESFSPQREVGRRLADPVAHKSEECGAARPSHSALSEPTALAAGFCNDSRTSRKKAPPPQPSPRVGGSKAGDPRTARLASSIPSLAREASFILSPAREASLTPAREASLIPSPSWGGLGRGEDRLIQVRLARLRGGAAGASLTLRIDFQTGSVQAARRDDEANRMRLSRRLAHPTVGRKTARA